MPQKFCNRIGGADHGTFQGTIIQGHADAVLAASLFHFGELKIPVLKKWLKSEGIDVRL